MTILFLDLETYSEVPIKNGTYVYAEAAEVMLVAFAVDDGPVEVIDFTHNAKATAAEVMALADKKGRLFADCMYYDTTIAIHNSMFDRTVLRHALGVEIPVERVHDTMVRALAHGLPGSLGTLCEIMGVPVDKAKDKRGRELVNLFCKPRPKNQKLRRATRETHPVEWRQFVEYARLDVEAMRAVYHKLPSWNYRNGELELWRLDQRINDRGVCVDTELARAAITAVERAQSSLATRTSTATLGLVSSANKRDQLLRFILGAYGVELPDLQADTLERRMSDPDLPIELRNLLGIRLQASTTSTSKYKSLINAVSPDNRLRGTLQFCGASRTGRWSGRTFQPQNLPRPNLKQKVIDDGIEALKAGCADLLYDNVMELTSNAIRGCIVAPAGRKLVVSDLSNIEGRTAAWLAGEEWKLEAFRNYDAGEGTDLYRLAYAKAFNIDPSEVDGGEEKGPQRQIGKVMELMLQYEGGVGAFITGAATYGIDLDEMAEAAWDVIPADTLAEAEGAWKWATKRKQTFGLEAKTYVVCDALKRLWREAHPEINSYWPELSVAYVYALSNPGVDCTCRKLTFRRDGAWLRIILPSGRSLCYASPRCEDGKISYMGMDNYSRKWRRITTYGGKLFENICQAVARDVMAANMPKIEEAGYEIVLSVHDELITEAPMTYYTDPTLPPYPSHTSRILSKLLATNPKWAPDLPLAAGGFENYRYKKD